MTIQLSRKLLALPVLLLILGAVVASYEVGRKSIDQRTIRKVAYAHGYRIGRSAGDATGITTGMAIEEPVAYQKGYNAAVKKANRNVSRILTSGQNLAFAGYTTWTVGDWYIVHVEAGPTTGVGASKYNLAQRVGPMTLGESYDVCPDGSGDMCSYVTPG